MSHDEFEPKRKPMNPERMGLLDDPAFTRQEIEEARK